MITIGLIISGGGAGNRTQVRRRASPGIYMFIPSFKSHSEISDRRELHCQPKSLSHPQVSQAPPADQPVFLTPHENPTSEIFRDAAALFRQRVH